MTTITTTREKLMVLQVGRFPNVVAVAGEYLGFLVEEFGSDLSDWTTCLIRIEHRLTDGCGLWVWEGDVTCDEDTEEIWTCGCFRRPTSEEVERFALTGEF